jgi:hypothetical protein
MNERFPGCNTLAEEPIRALVRWWGEYLGWKYEANGILLMLVAVVALPLLGISERQRICVAKKQGVARCEPLPSDSSPNQLREHANCSFFLSEFIKS